MKTTEFNERLRKDRSIMTITVRMPEDVACRVGDNRPFN